MSKTQLPKVTDTFFIKKRGKFAAVVIKRTLPCKKVIKEFSLFKSLTNLPLCKRWNTRYLFII